MHYNPFAYVHDEKDISHPCAEQIIIIENEVPNLDYAGVNMRRFSKGNGFWKTDPTTYQG